MRELAPLPDDISALLQAAATGAPPPPPGLEAAVLAKVTATTAAAAAASTAPTTLLGTMAAKPLATIVVALGVAAGGGGVIYLATRSAPTQPPAIERAPVAAAAMERAQEVLVPIAEPAIERPAATVESAPALPKRRAARAESELLEGARNRLARGDGEGALELLREHARRYPTGKLHEERRALTVVAFAQQGDRERANAAARAFEREHPSSLFLEMVRAAAIDEAGGMP